MSRLIHVAEYYTAEGPHVLDVHRYYGTEAVARALPIELGPVRLVLEFEERRVRLALERLLFLLDLDGLEGVRGPEARQEEVRKRSVLLDEVLEDGFERFGVRDL